MESAAYVPIMLGMAMVIYLAFAFIRRATRDPEREEAQLRETDRRLTEIDEAAERDNKA